MRRASLAPGDPLRGELGDTIGPAERAALVTRQLLGFGRRRRLAPFLGDLGSHVAHMNRVLQRILGEGVELGLDLARPLGLVRVDAGQLEQVILHVVVNAHDAMQRGGRLSIKTHNVTLEPAEEGRNVDVPAGRRIMLVIGDSERMTEEVRTHIFEPFFTTAFLHHSPSHHKGGWTRDRAWIGHCARRRREERRPRPRRECTGRGDDLAHVPAARRRPEQREDRSASQRGGELRRDRDRAPRGRRRERAPVRAACAAARRIHRARGEQREEARLIAEQHAEGVVSCSPTSSSRA